MASAPPRPSSPPGFSPVTSPPRYGAVSALDLAPAPVGSCGPVATAAYRRRLLAAVDSVPEARGSGVVLSDHGQVAVLRAPRPGESFVVIQLRPSSQARRAPSPAAAPAPEQVSVGKEWLNLALNLGGATLSWIGVVGSAAVAPETGGLSLGGTVLLYSGATASSLQVANSVTRLIAIYSGHGRWVSNLDHNSVYTRTSTTLDVIGLIGAGAAAKETVATARALDEVGRSFR